MSRLGHLSRPGSKTVARHRGRRRASRRRIFSAVPLAVTVTVLGTGVAVAFWSTAGSGSGSSAAGSASPLTTTAATPSGTSLLYPNGPAADVKLIVKNSNPFPVTVTSVSADGAVTGTGGIGNCTTTGVSFQQPSAGLPFTVPARSGGNDGSQSVTLTNAAQMSNTSDSGCQGATFTIPLTLTGTSS